MLAAMAVKPTLDHPPAISGNCHPARVHFTGRIAADAPGPVKLRVKVAVDGLSLRTQAYFTGPGASAAMCPMKCTRAGWQLPVIAGG